MHRVAVALVAGVVWMGGCAMPDRAGEDLETMALGPVDGLDLPGVDLERVQVGDVAPDFVLTSLAGPRVRLSDFRGEQNVVLVFYRGHW